MRWWPSAVATLTMASVCVVPAFGQQSGTTETNCQLSGNNMNCTSQHVLSYEEARSLFGKHSSESKPPSADAGQLSPEAVKELLAEAKKERDAKDTVDYIYCRQNANGSVTDSEGKTKTCTDVIAYTKAFCLVNPVMTAPWLPATPEAERCSLAKSKAQVQKAFATLADDYNHDPRRNKRDLQTYFDSLFTILTKWGCMSFPDMILPQRDGTLHPCPDAPEPAKTTDDRVSIPITHDTQTKVQ
jgi:hypothetical protein